MLKINFKTVKMLSTCLLRSVAARWGHKKVVLFPGINQGKFFLSFTRLHSHMFIIIYIYFLKKQKNKKKRTRTQTKTKETKEEKRISPENRLEKIICGRPREDFSCHPHFQKQEYFFWPGEVFLNFSFLQKYLRRRKCQAEIP